eukprot:scaffold8890_cov88-Skeletonema_menzelii.AAC.2
MNAMDAMDARKNAMNAMDAQRTPMNAMDARKNAERKLGRAACALSAMASRAFTSTLISTYTSMSGWCCSGWLLRVMVMLEMESRTKAVEQADGKVIVMYFRGNSNWTFVVADVVILGWICPWLRYCSIMKTYERVDVSYPIFCIM